MVWKPYGRAFAIAIGMLICVSLSSAVAAEAGGGDCRLVRYAHLDITPDRAGRPTVPVMLDGTQEQFLIDTAGAYSAVSPDIVETLKLRTKPLRHMKIVNVASGASPDKMAFVHRLLIGNYAIPRMSFFVIPKALVSPDYPGALAGDVLHAFDAEFDPANAKFSLFHQDTCPSRVVHWTRDPHAELGFRMDNVWHVIAPATLDGKPVEVTLDTGSSVSVLFLDDIGALIPDGDKAKMVQLNPKADAKNAVYRYPFASLDFGPVKVNHPDIRMLPGSMCRGSPRCPDTPQLVLGANVLNQLHIFIAYNRKKLYITAADAH